MKLYFRLIGISFFFVFLASVIEAKSISEIIIDVKWGSAQGMVGIDESNPEMPAMAPSSIDIDDKGNIYILDIVNKRINKYSSNGKFIMDIPLLEFAGTVAIGKNEIIYTLGGARLRVTIYEKDGQYLGSYDCEDSWQEVQRLLGKPLTSPFMNTDEQGSPVLTSSAGLLEDYVFEIIFGDSTCELIPKKKMLGMYGNTYPWVVSKRDKNSGITLRKKKKDKDIVVICSPKGYRHGFLGCDREDNFYFDGSPLKNWKDSKIYKYNKTGLLIDSTDILPSPHQYKRIGPAGSTYAKLDREGNFYQLIVTLSGAKIMKWSF